MLKWSRRYRAQVFSDATTIRPALDDHLSAEQLEERAMEMIATPTSKQLLVPITAGFLLSVSST